MFEQHSDISERGKICRKWWIFYPLFPFHWLQTASKTWKKMLVDGENDLAFHFFVNKELKSYESQPLSHRQFGMTLDNVRYWHQLYQCSFTTPNHKQYTILQLKKSVDFSVLFSCTALSSIVLLIDFCVALAIGSQTSFMDFAMGIKKTHS